MLTVRTALKTDLPAIMKVLEAGRQIMISSGNPNQWAQGYPTEEMVLKDIGPGYGKIVEEGTVYDIFSDPQAPITRKFIASASPLGKIDKMIARNSSLTQLKPGEVLVKTTFQKDCVGEHILTTMAQRYGIDLNIILANVEYLHGNPLGGTIGILSGPPENLEAGRGRKLANNVLKTLPAVRPSRCFIKRG